MYLEDARGQRPAPRHDLSLSLLLKAAENLAYGELVVLSPQGHAHRFEGAQPGPSAVLEVHDSTGLRRVLARSDTGFAEAFMAGDVDTPDLDALLELGALNEAHLSRILAQKKWFRLLQRGYHLLRRNSKVGSRRNVRAHYDLGNDFYALWLDESMTYSSGLFEDNERSLADAQAQKYDRLLSLLDSTPQQRVLEFGCGWGGFASAVAQARGSHVTGITLSREQLRYCQALAKRRSLTDRLEFRLQDYRDVVGEFDCVASIEMFEAVGEAYWPTYFQSIARSLRPGGRAALQIITVDEAVFPSYRLGCDFIQRYIFPGGMLAPAPLVERLAAAHGLETVRQDFFGEDYARTLELWHERFVERSADVRALGFDDEFLRMWRYYLSYCRAGFRTGRVSLMQTLLVKNGGAQV